MAREEKMAREEFEEILKDVADFPDDIIDRMWKSRWKLRLEDNLELRRAALDTALAFNLPMRVA